MKVILADELGFCFGVRRAYELALENAENSAIIGELVHNSDVQQSLYDSGIKDFSKSKDVKNLILRSHGTVLEEKQLLQEKYNLIDTTCPVLLNIYKKLREYNKQGYVNVIFGSKDHPEVIATASQVSDVIIVENKNDIDKLDSNKKYYITMQTTLNDEVAKELADYFLEKFKDNKDIIINNTICSASRKRREAILRLSEVTDCIIILGGENSNNTKELANLLKEKNFPYYLTKSVFSLDLSSIKKYNIVGISAGASTPDWIIEETVRVLNDIDRNIEG